MADAQLLQGTAKLGEGLLVHRTAGERRMEVMRAAVGVEQAEQAHVSIVSRSPPKLDIVPSCATKNAE